jgi:hypothetical protein
MPLLLRIAAGPSVNAECKPVCLAGLTLFGEFGTQDFDFFPGLRS